MAYQYFDSEVIEILDENDSVKRFFFRVAGLEKFTFKAGQFIMLDLPLNSKVNNRSYSIASNPTENNEFELVVVLKPDGLGTNYLFNEQTIKPGTKVKCSKALGKFTLDETTEKEICFICTGTGIAPFRAMLMDLERKGTLKDKKINLIFGCRFEKDFPTSIITLCFHANLIHGRVKKAMFMRFTKDYMPINNLLFSISVVGKI